MVDRNRMIDWVILPRVMLADPSKERDMRIFRRAPQMLGSELLTDAMENSGEASI